MKAGLRAALGHGWRHLWFDRTHKVNVSLNTRKEKEMSAVCAVLEKITDRCSDRSALARRFKVIGKLNPDTMMLDTMMTRKVWR
ncbi:hypothetical protein C0J45_13809 [Silurus meridionalis]|nr:hypothetical protein C0J45_13809 [Silurus meridionalis]